MFFIGQCAVSLKFELRWNGNFVTILKSVAVCLFRFDCKLGIQILHFRVWFGNPEGYNFLASNCSIFVDIHSVLARVPTSFSYCIWSLFVLRIRLPFWAISLARFETYSWSLVLLVAFISRKYFESVQTDRETEGARDIERSFFRINMMKKEKVEEPELFVDMDTRENNLLLPHDSLGSCFSLSGSILAFLLYSRVLFCFCWWWCCICRVNSTAPQGSCRWILELWKWQIWSWWVIFKLKTPTFLFNIVFRNLFCFFLLPWSKI